MKKLLLIIVDAFASRVVLPAMERGQLPHLKALSEAGQLFPESIAIFPSLTPAATSSIITGTYPHKHGVLGFHWYDLNEDQVIYYGDDFWIIWREGFEKFLNDFLDRLNHRRLQAKTLFQIVEQAGLTAASLNYLIFRGEVKHQANVPTLFRLIPGVPGKKTVWGPEIMYFGDLVETKIKKLNRSPAQAGGMFNRFGFDDANTAHLWLELARTGSLPQLTVAYFPDNDFRSHEVGPEAAVETLENFDAHVGDFIDACGGLEQMLAEYALVLTGDHAQTDMLDDPEQAGIRLDSLLEDFTIAPAGQPWHNGEQLVICPDMRSAQIYFRDPTERHLQAVVDRLLADPRVDQAMWRASTFSPDGQGYYVRTQERGKLHFWEGQAGPHTALDAYENRWSWQGDLATVDGVVSADKRLAFGAYPNAFERIVGGLAADCSGHLWLTARPGYEFSIAETSLHVGGGSHGSLSRQDSLSPLLIAGAPTKIQLSARPRAVDIVPICLQILGLNAEVEGKEGRVAASS